ncbi:MAG TPA: tripartite tricarboxylate transporter substrate-binding protein [Thermodesulfobacteriota bacterium]|nr:tripartite tricarboxylate transporter substrate-binding protein [Thermodesulfobacteriota bacterium]
MARGPSSTGIGAARGLAAALGVGAALLLACAAAAAAPFYEGKTLTIVVGYDPGGGYDRMARVVARHLPKHLPGSPAVVVQNMPGAASVIAANYLYTVAKPDGLTIGAFNRNLPLGQLVKAEGIRFDVRKFAWIGSMATENNLLLVRSDLPIASFADIQKLKEPLVVGATGPGASSYDFPMLLKAYLGANLRVLSGYKSSADTILALERKEVDAVVNSYSSVKPFIERGLLRPVVRTRATEPEIRHLPVDEELAPTPLARAVLALRSIPEVIGRPYVAPPGTPAERLEILREAFARVARDPEAIADAARGKLTLHYVPGAEAERIVAEIFTQPDEVVREFTKHVRFGD